MLEEESYFSRLDILHVGTTVTSWFGAEWGRESPTIARWKARGRHVLTASIFGNKECFTTTSGGSQIHSTWRTIFLSGMDRWTHENSLLIKHRTSSMLSPARLGTAIQCRR